VVFFKKPQSRCGIFKQQHSLGGSPLLNWHF
jgi:hypothetical protein